MPITVTLPDGATRSLNDGATALDLAKSISQGLADVAGADLRQLGDGKLVAPRNQPKPAVTMRLVLD